MADVVLAEHCLIDKEGHYYEYDLAVKTAFERTGLCCQIVGNLYVDKTVQRDLNVIPHFSWCFNGRYPFWFRYLKRVAGFGQRLWMYAVYSQYRRDLDSLQDRVNWERESLLFFPTVLPAEALAILHWWDELPANRIPHLGILLRFPVRQQYFGNRWSERVYRRLFRDARASSDSGRMHWFSDSSRLVQQYEQCGGKEFTVLPIPRARDLPKSLEEKNGGVKAVDFRFLGRAVPEKGYTLLPDIFEPFAEDIAQGRLKLTVQAGIQPTGEPPVDQASERLRQLGAAFLGRILDSEDYEQATAAADVVVLPYWRRENEYAGTSAVFADALSNGKPVIVTDETWMSDQLTEFGAGFAVASGDIGGFRQAVQRCLDEYPNLQKRATAEAHRWRQIHNADHFVQRLLDVTSGFSHAAS